MRKRRSSKPTEAQQRAIANNNCLRILANLSNAFDKAGHPDFAGTVALMDGSFRQKLEINS